MQGEVFWNGGLDSKGFTSQARWRKMLASDTDERLLSVLSALEECRAALIGGGDRETALVLSVAILELRMKINRIADSELKALCDAMVPEDAPARPQYAKPQGQRSRPQLKLVK